MDDAEPASEIWFERIGPSFGWWGSYMPTTMRGFYAVLMHTLPLLVLWVLPLSLLAQFGTLSSAATFLLVMPAVVGCLTLLMRTAYRHSSPRT